MTIEPRPGEIRSSSYSRATTAPSWLEQNKPLVLRLSIVGAAVLLVALTGSLWAGNQSTKANNAFNQAMEVYDAPIQQAGEPPIPNAKAYPSIAARAKAAQPLFQQTADSFGLFTAGKNARYFAGLSAADMGDQSKAEQDLKKVTTSGSDDLESLAKMALASLYVQSGRQSQAATLYHDVIDHPTVAVSANAARLALAGSEESSNPQEAREMYAKIKDSDKAGAAGEIAASKLHAQ